MFVKPFLVAAICFWLGLSGPYSTRSERQDYWYEADWSFYGRRRDALTVAEALGHPEAISARRTSAATISACDWFSMATPEDETGNWTESDDLMSSEEEERRGARVERRVLRE